MTNLEKVPKSGKQGASHTAQSPSEASATTSSSRDKDNEDDIKDDETLGGSETPLGQGVSSNAKYRERAFQRFLDALKGSQLDFLTEMLSQPDGPPYAAIFDHVGGIENARKYVLLEKALLTVAPTLLDEDPFLRPGGVWGFYRKVFAHLRAPHTSSDWKGHPRVFYRLADFRGPRKKLERYWAVVFGDESSIVATDFDDTTPSRAVVELYPDYKILVADKEFRPFDDTNQGINDCNHLLSVKLAFKIGLETAKVRAKTTSFLLSFRRWSR